MSRDCCQTDYDALFDDRAGRLFRHPAPFAIHPDRAVDARIRAAGFTPILEERGLAWQTVLYRRTG